MFVGNAGMVIVFALVVLTFVSGLIWGESLYALTPHGKRLRASHAGYADGHRFGEWDANHGSVFEAIMMNSNYRKNNYKSEKEQQAYHESFQQGMRDAQGELLLTKPLVSWAN